MNIGVQVFLQDANLIFSGCIPRRWLMDHMVVLFLTFFRTVLCIFHDAISIYGLPKVVLVIKNPPANAAYVRDVWVRCLGQEDPLEEGIETHSSILARRIPGTEELGRLQSIGSQSQTLLKQLSTHACIPIYIPTSSIQSLSFLQIFASTCNLLSF